MVCVVICTVAINWGGERGRGSPKCPEETVYCTVLTGTLLIRRILAGKHAVKETQEC